MTAAPDGPIAIYYEHPDWFKPLFAELDRREIAYVRVDASAHSYDPSETHSPYSLVFNRASPSAYLRGHKQVTFHTLSWLRHLERIRVPLVNGPASYQMEISKALQLEVLNELGLRSMKMPSLRLGRAIVPLGSVPRKLLWKTLAPGP